MNDKTARRYGTHTETITTPAWATQAARNVLDILPHLVEPGEDVPVIRIEDLAGRIAGAFRDRADWNQKVHESHLEPEQKLFLVVP